MKVSYIIKNSLLYVHAAKGSIVAEAQQLCGMRLGECHAAHWTGVGLKEQDTIITPVTTLEEHTHAVNQWLEFI